MPSIQLEITRGNFEDESTLLLEVAYNIIPNEYENGYLFVRGGVELDEVLHDGNPVLLDPHEEDLVLDMIRKEVGNIPNEYYYI